MWFLIALALLPLLPAFLKAIPGLLLILLGLFAIAVVVHTPRVVLEYPALAGVTVLVGIAIAAASIWVPRLLARKLFELRCLRMITKFKQGDTILYCEFLASDRNLYSNSRYANIMNHFVWSPRPWLRYPGWIERLLSVLMYIMLIFLTLLNTIDVRQQFLDEIAADRDKSLYPWSMGLMFAFAMFATNWVDRRLSKPERYSDNIHDTFHVIVNRHMSLDQFNKSENLQLISSIRSIQRFMGLSDDDMNAVFFSPVAHYLTSAIQSGRDLASLSNELNYILRRELEEFDRAKTAMREIFRLKEEVMFIQEKAPDISERGFRIQKFLENVENWKDLNEIVFRSPGINALTKGRERAEQISSDLKQYIADRRREHSGEGRTSGHGSARGPGSQHRARDGDSTQSPPRSGRMTRAEALSILGLTEGASRADIIAAHRRLIKAVHPDVGGTAGLAARLNEARDVLLAG